MSKAISGKRGRAEMLRGIAKTSLGVVAAAYAVAGAAAAVFSPFIFLFPAATMLLMAWVLNGLMTFGGGFFLPLPLISEITAVNFAVLYPFGLAMLSVGAGMVSFLMIRAGVATCKKAHRILQKNRLLKDEGRPLLDATHRNLPSVTELRESFEQSAEASGMHQAAARRHLEPQPTVAENEQEELLTL